MAWHQVGIQRIRHILCRIGSVLFVASSKADWTGLSIDALTAQYIEYGILEFREETTDFYGNETLLIDQGNYILVYGNDNVREVGKYLNVWRKEGDDWKIHSNIWNTNAPQVSTD